MFQNVGNYQSTLRNISEERGSQVYSSLQRLHEGHKIHGVTDEQLLVSKLNISYIPGCNQENLCGVFSNSQIFHSLSAEHEVCVCVLFTQAIPVTPVT